MYPDVDHTPMVRRDAPPVRSEVEPEQDVPLVSVVIPCYNHAHFLDEAIESVLQQSYQPVEILVVDDGSTDDTAAVAARYAQVRCIHQDNQGLAAARNTGIQASQGAFLVFLDADDRLLPNAIAMGVRCLHAHPDCAFASGTFRWIGADGALLGVPRVPEVGNDPYRALLRRNYIAMHAAVIYRRAALNAVGGFDPALAACEDYDVYLRLAQRFPVQCHHDAVAEYRMHGANMSGDSRLILQTALAALRRQWAHVRSDRRSRRAYEDGVRFWIETYGRGLIDPDAPWRVRDQEGRRGMRLVLRYAPEWFVRQAARQALRQGFRLVKPVLPLVLRRRLQRRWAFLGVQPPPPVGHVRFGDLRRLEPVDRFFGYGRGVPIDRYYIERFLERHAEAIRGRVLEIKDNAYTRRFGGDQVRQSDVLDIDASNPMATLIGDLTQADHLPASAFDCIILTQTLHLIYDVRAALATLYHLLKPGGVLLATVPGITKVDPEGPWFWSFTASSVQRLVEEQFTAGSSSVEVYGNVLAAQAFLQGLAVAELRPEELDHCDPEYPVSIVFRAVKPGAA